MAETLALLFYKILSLIVGLCFAYMGYRLFMSSVWGQAGELDAKFGKNRILLKKAAPGTFFALFGAVVVALTIWKGIQFDSVVERKASNEPQLSSTSKPQPPEGIIKGGSSE